MAHYTLRLSIQRKNNGRFTKTYSSFNKKFQQFQKDCKENLDSPFKGLNCIIDGNNEKLYIFFISPNRGYLQDVKDSLEGIIISCSKLCNEEPVYKFFDGVISELETSV
jgi:hypothetical protein